MTDLDQSGNFSRFARTWCGPTLGWQLLPIAPETITTATSITVGPGQSVILVNLSVAHTVTVTLPDVNFWVSQFFDLGRTRSNLDRSIVIKDIGGTCSEANAFTITPFSGQKVDGQNSVSIIAPYSWARLFPLNNLTGWYMA